MLRLNPYFDGISSLSKVMETIKQKRGGLNPYFDGISSLRDIEAVNNGSNTVLILILMEYAL